MISLGTNDKIIRILKRMDVVLSKNGYFQHQERLHRIYKTLLSIERHDGCFVSNFNPEGDNEEEFSVNYIYKQNIDTNNYITEQSGGNIEIEREEESYQLELDDLFGFIEDELNLKNLINIEDSTVYSSSSEEDADTKGSDDEKKPNCKPKLHFESLQKKFFEIELKLRGYLKNQDIFKNYSFDTVLNDKKLQTPLSKLDHRSNPLPTIVKNFFEDKAILDAAKKRYSVRGDIRGGLGLPEIEEINKCKSHIDKIKLRPHTENNSKVSDFNFNSNNETPTDSSNLTQPQFIQRGSIFKQNNPSGFNAVEENESENEESEYETDEEGESYEEGESFEESENN